ncbi:MAG: hypothetical protein QOH14_2613 [Pseudonocardiales bacterium]|jgi:uncharacterized protein (DUF58 family)|nr:hypothetical protein [Pseudonocardiales bacterium]
MALTGRLIALAALGLLVAAVSAAAALAFAGVLALLVVLDLLLAARIADLRLAREPSAPVRLGELGETTLRIGNDGRRPLRAIVRDAWVPSAGATPRLQPVAVRPGERRTLGTALRPTRRGDRIAAQVTVRSFGPLGVAARQRRLAVPGALRVLPAFGSRRFLPEKLSRLRQIDGAVLVRRRGQGSEFDSLRTYVIGDDVRAIDWRATARSRDVVVRTWRPERDRHIVLAIDTGRTSAARLGDEPRLDAALDACLLLGAVASRAGDRVALVAADIAVRGRLAATGGRDVLPKLVAALTPLEPALVETDPQLLAAEVLRQVPKRSLVVLFSALDTAADTGLLPAARALAARHELVVASVADPSVAALAAARGDAADVYTAAAAELSAAARRAVSEQLLKLGATVVDSPADVFASHVTDAYLDLKAAGRL